MKSKKKEICKRASASAILALVNRIETVASLLEKVVKELWGNGTPGIKTEVTIIKAQLALIGKLLAGLGAGVAIPIVYLIVVNMFHLKIGG